MNRKEILNELLNILKKYLKINIIFGGETVILEIGVGFNTPSIIRFPF